MNPGRRILVIDDETSICRFLRASLEANEFVVFEAHTNSEGLRGILANKPDIIILDLGLPDVPGIELLKKLREWSQTPVIVLTAQDSEEDKVQALDLGADDYLTKPFSVAELLARIRVAMRHSQVKVDSPVFRSGQFEMNFAAHLVKVRGQAIKFTATEYEILKVLVRNAGKVVTHRMLLKEVWGPNSTEHTQYVRVYLGQIRKKLHVVEGTPELIVTEAGVGYRFVFHADY